jgi:predicted kinase
LDEARREAAASRTRLKGYEDAESARSDAAKSELQKANERAEAAEKARDEGLAQVKSFQLRITTAEAARRLGFRNPEIAHRLLDVSRVEYTDEGQPKNIESLLTKVAESDPYLVTGRPGTPDLGAGPRGTPPGADINSMIRRATGRG